ncbi:PilC/PilY family type IV pilus protein [Sphaerotilaceae bacterium SBD11-9]
MKPTATRLQSKRMIAAIVTASMLLQTTMPVFATVSQLPGIFFTPPDSNVMFTLDDSGSMTSDAIPDFGRNVAGMPTNNASSTLNGYGSQFPSMWKSGTSYLTPTYYASTNAIARYLRSAAGNPLYYNPRVTYQPWPLASNDTLLNAAANVRAVNIHTSDPFSGEVINLTTQWGNVTTTICTSYRANGTCRTYGTTTALQELPEGTTQAEDEANNFWPATYYVYNGTAAMLPANPADASNISTNFTKVQIKPSVTAYARAATRTDCTGAVSTSSGCSYAEELQNFANWLQYYRSRMLMAKGGVSSAFAKQATNLRVGFGTINTNGTIRNNQGVGQFTGTRRSSFFTDLYSINASGGTALRQAMDNVGQYFRSTGVNSPWAYEPRVTQQPEYDCRKSFHILSTDGYWNGAAAPTTDARSVSNDQFSGSTPTRKIIPPETTGRVYTYGDNIAPNARDNLVGRFTVSPFSDALAATDGNLADIAAYYWKTDLRTDIQNNVFPSTRDPAFWQHLSTFTVGLGISGTGTVRRTSDNTTVVPATEPTSSPFNPYIGKAWLSEPGLRDLLVSQKTPLTWSTVVADTATTGDDLIHAAMDGRGRYFSANDPDTLARNLASALSEATDRPGSLSNITTESTGTEDGRQVYQATYTSDKWYGRLYAFPIVSGSVIDTTPSSATWEASNRMPTPANRRIYTWDASVSPRAGSTFTWAGLNTAQRGYLDNDSTLLDYLRGSETRELQNNGVFRERSRYTVNGVKGGVLGDIVNSSPVKGPNFGAGYDRLDSSVNGQATYAAFRSSATTPLDSMRNSLFVGANDGMLHAFDITNGVEHFAYVPNSVFSVPRSKTGTEAKLKMLSVPGYEHRFTVDGQIQVADAFLGTAATATTGWHSVLTGSTGAGARSVFALDVTNPAATAVTAPRIAAPAFDQTKVLWEFSEADNADMGYVLGYPQIARMRGTASDDRWVAIFGNGYDSRNGQAKLFILDLKTGAVLWEQAVGAAGGNGLGQPNFTLNSRREVVAIYAGDLKGNMWKFDVNYDSIASWNVAFSGTPLFTTPQVIPGTTSQPITSMPELTLHPTDPNSVMVSFGTGKMFETEDTASTVALGNVNKNQQALYGIWDKPGETSGFSGTSLLVEQPIVAGGTSSNPVDYATRRGWFIPLAAGTGERSTVYPMQVKDVLIMVANTPLPDPCGSGGSSRIFYLDAGTGSPPAFAVQDANRDGSITTADRTGNILDLNYAMSSRPTVQLGRGNDDVSLSHPWNDRGQTGAQSGGVELAKTTDRTDCTGRLLTGLSDTSIDKSDIRLCEPAPSGPAPRRRISWRQIQ